MTEIKSTLETKATASLQEEIDKELQIEDTESAKGSLNEIISRQELNS